MAFVGKRNKQAESTVHVRARGVPAPLVLTVGLTNQTIHARSTPPPEPVTALQDVDFELDYKTYSWHNSNALTWPAITAPLHLESVLLYHPIHPEPLMSMNLPQSVDLKAGDTFSFPAGSLSISGEAFDFFTFPPENYLIEEEPEITDLNVRG